MNANPANLNDAALLVGLTARDWFCRAHNRHRRARSGRGDPQEPWQGAWLVP